MFYLRESSQSRTPGTCVLLQNPLLGEESLYTSRQTEIEHGL
jgi:hypothetical protein